MRRRGARRRAVALAVVVGTTAGGCQGPDRPEAWAPPAVGEANAPAIALGRPVAPLDRTTPYRGLGTWIDIYDDAVWEHPTRSVRLMAERDVRTIYLQTSNFSRGRPFVHPEALA